MQKIKDAQSNVERQRARHEWDKHSTEMNDVVGEYDP